MARLTRYWQNALYIVQPDTPLRWHRDPFRLYWRRKSRKRKQKPRIPQETIDLIQQMANENCLRGVERIRGELLKLGVRVSKRTIQRFMPKRRIESSQTWTTFLTNNAGGILACDFTDVHDLLFRLLFIFIVIMLKTRRIAHATETRHPTNAWSAQQLRRSAAWGKGPGYLIRDRDKNYGILFSVVTRNTGIKEMRTPILTFQTPHPTRAGGNAALLQFIPDGLLAICLEAIVVNQLDLTDECSAGHLLMTGGSRQLFLYGVPILI